MAISTPVLTLALMCVALSAFPDTVRFADGDVLNGEILESNPDFVVLDHRVLGKLTIPRADIAEILHTDSEKPGEHGETPGADADQAPSENDSEVSEETETFKLYSDKFGSRLIRIELALDGSHGNTNEQSTRMKLKYSVRKDRKLRGLEATYYLKVKESDTTDNKLVVEGNQIWLLQDSRWMILGNVRFDYNEFESWDERVTTRLGPGYRLYDREKLWLAVEGGPGAKREFGSQSDDWEIEAWLGTDLIWHPSARQSIEFGIFSWSVVDDPEDYRALTNLDWRTSLSDKLKLSLVTGLSLEYQAVVDPGKEKLDFRNFVGLSFEF